MASRRWLAILLAASMLQSCSQAPDGSVSGQSAPATYPEIPVGASALLPSGPDVTLDEELESLAAHVQPPEAPSLTSLAETIGAAHGKIVVGRQLSSLPLPLRAAALQRALKKLSAREISSIEAARSSVDGQTLRLARQAQEREVEALRQRLANVPRQLADGPLEQRLRELLQHPRAADVLLAFDATGDDGGTLPSDIAAYFEQDDQGHYTIPAEQRDAAASYLQQLQPVVEAVDDGASRLRALSDRLHADSPVAHRLKAAMRDPLLAGAAAVQLAEAGRPVATLAQAIEQEVKKTLRPRGGEWELGEADRRKIEKVLNDFDKLREATAQSTAEFADAAARIRGDDPLHSGYREVLVSPVAAILVVAREMNSGGSSRTGLEQTVLGDVLVRRGQQLAVTRWRRGYAEQLTHDLQRLLQDADLLAAPLDEFIAAIRDADVQQHLQEPLNRLKLVKRLSDFVEEDATLRLQTWVDAHFIVEGEKAAVRQGSIEQMTKLLQLAETVKQQIAAEPVVKADLAAARFESEKLSLFESSAFYNPRSSAGRGIYRSEFLDHHAARLWGVFEWDAHQSTDFASFMKRLRDRKEEIAELARTHDELMVMLSFTPNWLSRTNDQRIADGHWQHRNAVRPKDWATWERMVEESVKFLTQFEEVEWYFEVWNEPDLPYWQEGTDEYLELYAHTAAAVRRAAPAAKIGGAGLNSWQRQPRQSPKRGPLNIDLIRFAKDRNLPLDFVSWHAFDTDEQIIRQAAEAYRDAIRKAGYTENPELLVTEWNVGAHKGTDRAAGAFADRMLMFYDVGVQEQFFSAWEEFNTGVPADDSVGPWGMITQEGRKKPEFHVHKLFDELARESQGVSVFRSADGLSRAIVSRESAERYDVLLWETGLEAGAEAAIKTLLQNGVTVDDVDRYQTFQKFVEALQSVRPLNNRHRAAFEKARVIYEQNAQPNLIRVAFPGISDFDVLEAKRVGITLEPMERLYTSGTELVADVPRMQVLWLRLEVKQ